jgi:SAM-dependent methyltransferase
VPCERRILSELTRPGMRALDVGCGATGRSARLLAALGLEAVACDVSLGNLAQLRRDPTCPRDLKLLAADLQRLPFRDAAFDVVLIAQAGLDYVWPAPCRRLALAEASRVLRPGGHLVFSSHNSLGMLLSPRGLKQKRYWRWRLAYLRSGAYARETFRDLDGIELWHALPAAVIRQASSSGPFALVCATNRGGWTRRLPLLTLFSRSPYYVFVRR